MQRRDLLKGSMAGLGSGLQKGTIPALVFNTLRVLEAVRQLPHVG